MKITILLSTTILILNSLSALAKEVNTSPNAFDIGGEIRFRLNNPKNIPIDYGRNDGTVIKESFYSQTRSQLWGEYTFNENTKFRARVSNEFRKYDQSKPNKLNSWKATGEWVFDELYIDIKEPFNRNIDLRIGRQELFYGTGKVMADGTPADGSRTTYSNAIKSTLSFAKNHVLDVFYFNNPIKDTLAINSDNRNLVEWDESGFGIHGTYQAKIDKFVNVNYYYIHKDEKHAVTDGKPINLNTMGIRFNAHISPTIKTNIELAKQWGRQDSDHKQGLLFDAQVDWLLSEAKSYKPTLSFGYYYLSGDDPSTSKNEAWSPVLSRWPQHSSLYLLSFIDGKRGRNAGSWSNLKMPWLGIELQPFNDAKLTLRYFNLSAATIDTKNFPNLGDERGNLITAKLKYKYNQNWSGSMFVEFLKLGDYYKQDLPDSSYVRFEVIRKF